jgi:hypothetical protein
MVGQFSDKYITSFPKEKMLMPKLTKELLFLRMFIDEKLQNNSASCLLKERAGNLS